VLLESAKRRRPPPMVVSKNMIEVPLGSKSPVLCVVGPW
jgi:hypothetical protein